MRKYLSRSIILNLSLITIKKKVGSFIMTEALISVKRKAEMFSYSILIHQIGHFEMTETMNELINILFIEVPYTQRQYLTFL